MTERKYDEFETSNRWLNDIPALRQRLKEQGYLFFRNVLDKQALLTVRRDILELANRHGMIKEGTDPIDGIYKGGAHLSSYKFETSRLYREILDIPSFNAFGQNPVLMLLYSGLLDAEVLEHRRRIGRLTFPQSFGNTTPPHQDFLYIKGSKETYTNWIPAGDCPHELGGLAILEGSNHLGIREHVPMSGTGGYGVPHEVCAATGLRWLTSDFELGDLLLFHSGTIHKALDNVTEDRLRVSLEYRIQRKDDIIEPGSMQYHMKGAFGDAE